MIYIGILKIDLKSVTDDIYRDIENRLKKKEFKQI